MKKRILLKIGGRAFDGESAYAALAGLHYRIPTVEFIIVHGGGAEITQALSAANRPTVFVDGLRVTTAEDIEIVDRVLSGTINARIADYLTRHGMPCQRLAGTSHGLFIVEPLRRHGRDLGFVGRIKQVNPAPVLASLQSGLTPVISPISADENGQKYNVNADSAAAALAVQANCTDLVYFTDVPGVKVGEQILPQLSLEKAQELIHSRIIKDGMVAKLESAFEALQGNVERVHITQWQNETTLINIVENKSDSGTIIHL